MEAGIILTQGQYDVIAKIFRGADTEESGNVPTSVVPSLAAKVLGTTAKESDLQLIQFWVSQREGEYGPGCEMSQWSHFSFLLDLMNRPPFFLLSSPFPPLSLVYV
jgi:hypothetical protein